MTVENIEFSGRDLIGFGKERLVSYFDSNPHLVASYQVFPDAVWRGTENPALVIETMDLNDEQLNILAVGMRLVMGQLKFVTPA